MNLKKFEEFISSGIVRKQFPNKERARSLIEEAEKKREFLGVVMSKIPKEQIIPNFVVESCYDTILELVRAKMFIEGFNTGNSHEAEVSYLRNLGFPEPDAIFMNEIRYNRNGIKYYGKILDYEYSDKTLKFLSKVYPKLKNILRGI